MDILDEDRLLTGFTVTGWVCLQKKFNGKKLSLKISKTHFKHQKVLPSSIKNHSTFPGQRPFLVFHKSLKRKELCASATSQRKNQKPKFKTPRLISCSTSCLFYKSDIKLYGDHNVTVVTGIGKHYYTALAFVCSNIDVNGNEFS